MKKLTALTAYDSSFAKLFDECGIDIILVGDSLGNVIKGCENTLCVGMEDMIYHTESVAKSCENATIIADMPHLSYENPKLALKNAQRLIECGAQMIKIEGGIEFVEVFEIFQQNNIQVCGHLGLQPQTMGYKVQGKDEKSAEKILQNALFLEKVGVQMLVLECIPSELATKITTSLNIPTIGIGAGNTTSGQVLVSYDMLGITSGKMPKFVKNFAQDCGVKQAVQEYIKQVQDSIFPSEEHSY